MTWGEFKHYMDEFGVKDIDVIKHMNVHNPIEKYELWVGFSGGIGVEGKREVNVHGGV